MKAIFKPPREPYTGNLLWNTLEFQNHQAEILRSLEMIRSLGYWASAFPEGDGISFTAKELKKKDIEMLTDFRSCFNWLNITLDLTFSKDKELKQAKRPSISEEEDINVSKADIAKIQLEDAIELFLSGKRLSVITLAGAADGIFAGILKQKGELSAAEETWEEIENIRERTGLKNAGDRNKRNAFNEWNQHKNKLKHHDKRDDDNLTFNAFDEAYYSLQRANLDGEKLGIVANNRQEYENWLIENIYM